MIGEGMTKLILSLFPGVGGFCRGFTRSGFTVVRGPDILMGEDVRDFNGVSGRFDGIIGGSPCVDYSGLNRNPGTYSDEMLGEYIRIVKESRPDWWLHENVEGCPAFGIEGYNEQRFKLDLAFFRNASRPRWFTFAHKDEIFLDPMIGKKLPDLEPCAVTGDKRPFETLRDIQTFEQNLTLTGFTDAGKKRLIANAVPPVMSEYLAQIINRDIYEKTPRMNGLLGDPVRRCGCGCKRPVYGRRTWATDNCRLRAFRARRRA